MDEALAAAGRVRRLALAACVLTELAGALPNNFTKLCAAVFAGWWFLQLFEELSWVVLVACVIPLVDALLGLARADAQITSRTIRRVHARLRVAFLVPGEQRGATSGRRTCSSSRSSSAQPRDSGSACAGTWLGMTFVSASTLVIASAADLSGLPALPVLSFGFSSRTATCSGVIDADGPSADSYTRAP